MKYINTILLSVYLLSCHNNNGSTFVGKDDVLRTPVFVYVNEKSDQEYYVESAVSMLHTAIGCEIFMVISEDAYVADVFIENHRNIKDGKNTLPKADNGNYRLADVSKQKRWSRTVFIVRMFADYKDIFQTMIYIHELLHVLGVDHDTVPSGIMNAVIDKNHDQLSNELIADLHNSYCQAQ